MSIRLDMVVLLSATLEAILYGFSLLMFGGTIWTLRTTANANHKMLVAACLLLFISTAHLVISIIRVMKGFVLLPDTHRGGPIAYFDDLKEWTFVSKHYLLTVQCLLGDAVVFYRCYMVWRSKRVIVFPVLLWCSIIVFGFGSPHIESNVRGFVATERLSMWIAFFWVSALATNVSGTFLLVYRIWNIDRCAKETREVQQSRLRPILYVILDAGIVYSFSLLAALVSFLLKTNFQDDVIVPIVSITFYMVILRVGLARLEQRSMPDAIQSNSEAARRKRQIQIATFAEREVDVGNIMSTEFIDGEDGPRLGAQDSTASPTRAG